MIADVDRQVDAAQDVERAVVDEPHLLRDAFEDDQAHQETPGSQTCFAGRDLVADLLGRDRDARDELPDHVALGEPVDHLDVDAVADPERDGALLGLARPVVDPDDSAAGAALDRRRRDEQRVLHGPDGDSDRRREARRTPPGRRAPRSGRSWSRPPPPAR